MCGLIQRVDADRQRVPSPGFLWQPGFLACPAQLGQVGDLVLAPWRADANDQVVKPVEPADPIQIDLGTGRVSLELERLGELHGRDSIIRFGGEGRAKMLDRRIEVVMSQCHLAAESGNPGMIRRRAGQQAFGLVEPAQVEGQVDAQGQGVGIGVGQRREDALDVVFDLGPFQQKLDDGQAAVAIVGVGRDEAIEVLNDVWVPVREVGERPGEKVVMS